MPWKIYYKPSTDIFVIRQRHSNIQSERVKAIQTKVAQLRPAVTAHQSGLAIASRKEVRYIGGQRQVVDVVPIKVFKAQLKRVMRESLGGAGAYM